ncbi:hypothetical protein K438DRAFT_1990935 [Mycena galopus ATCC 62051]|nr:hypothetical protein K438DRAFT_1990935 [Mycena galopus ATCC 62051]
MISYLDLYQTEEFRDNDIVLLLPPFSLGVVVGCRRRQRCSCEDEKDRRRPCPAEVLFVARTAVFHLGAKGAAEEEAISFPEALITQEGAPRKPKAVEVDSSHVHRFVKQTSEVHVPGRVDASRRKRALAGPSPLRSVHTAPQFAPISAVTPLSAKGPTARILAAFTRGGNEDTGSSDDDDDPSFTLSCDCDPWRLDTGITGSIHRRLIILPPRLASRLTSSLRAFSTLFLSASRHRVWGHTSTSTSG